MSDELILFFIRVVLVLISIAALIYSYQNLRSIRRSYLAMHGRATKLLGLPEDAKVTSSTVTMPHERYVEIIEYIRRLEAEIDQLKASARNTR